MMFLVTFFLTLFLYIACERTPVFALERHIHAGGTSLRAVTANISSLLPKGICSTSRIDRAMKHTEADPK